MRIIRAIWVSAFLISVGILLASLPGYWMRTNGMRLSTEFYPVVQSTPWLAALMAVSCAMLCLGLAVLLFLKKPKDRMALFLSFYLLLYGIVLVGPLETFLPFWFPASGNLALQIQGAIFVPGLALILIFPNGQFLPRWTRWLVVIAILEIPIALLTIGDFDELYRISSIPAQLLYAVLGVLLILALGAQVYRYRRLYTPLERQQTKWVLYGFVVSNFLLALVSIPYFYLLNMPPGLPPWWVGLGGVIWQVAVSILPLAFTIAILHSRLWNIDIIIRKTLIYSVLTALLAVIYVGGVMVFQQVFRTVIGHETDLAIAISTLVSAVVFLPLRRRVQNAIDKRFYRRKYDAAKTLAAFSATVRDEVELEKLTNELLNVVNETMQPANVSLWLKKADSSRWKIEG